MDARVEKLIGAFQQTGWSLLGPADVQSDWWFLDMLQLKSQWSPVDTDLYLTLLTDPQVSDRKIAWCIGISSGIPDNRHFSFIGQVTLNDIKRTDLSSLVERINKIVL